MSHYGEGRFTSTPVCIAKLLDEKMTKGKRKQSIAEGEIICCQPGDSSAIYFVATGQVKITVVSASGKEAVLAVLGPEEFFGEGSSSGRPSPVRMATALEPSTLLKIERRAMLQAIQDHPELRERLMNALLIRNMAIEEDLCDQFFNQTEKRLARTLLKLARFSGHEIRRDTQIPALSHETLAEMVGTRRSYITRFMVKFRKMGLIDYSGYVHSNPQVTVRTGQLFSQILQNTAYDSEMRSAA